MKHLALMALVLVSVTIVGCRIGGGFDSQARASKISKTGNNTAEVKGTDTTAEEPKGPIDPEVKSIADPIVYLSPAG